jgi:hypothetical protein
MFRVFAPCSRPGNRHHQFFQPGVCKFSFFIAALLKLALLDVCARPGAHSFDACMLSKMSTMRVFKLRGMRMISGRRPFPAQLVRRRRVTVGAKAMHQDELTRW